MLLFDSSNSDSKSRSLPPRASSELWISLSTPELRSRDVGKYLSFKVGQVYLQHFDLVLQIRRAFDGLGDAVDASS